MEILALLKLFFGFISSSIMTVVRLAGVYPRAAFATLLLIITIGIGYKIHNNFEDLKNQNHKLVEEVNQLNLQKQQLYLDIAAAVQANQVNQEVIGKLSVASEASKKRLQELERLKLVNSTKIQTIKEAIENSTPEEDGPISKVLANTIDAIQKNREEFK